jgi:hypothetical protein
LKFSAGGVRIKAIEFNPEFNPWRKQAEPIRLALDKGGKPGKAMVNRLVAFCTSCYLSAHNTALKYVEHHSHL